jgi:hypothetical protein
MKGLAENSSLSGVLSLEKINEKIEQHTECNYRDSLECLNNSLKMEIAVKSNVPNFRLMTSLNIDICQEAIDHPDYLTETVFNLESLVLKCLQKDINSNTKEKNASYQKYINYVCEIEDRKFDTKVMSKLKDKILMSTFKMSLQSKAKDYFVSEPDQQMQDKSL